MRERVFYVGTDRHSKSYNKPSKIVGVEMVTPEGGDPIPCFRIQISKEVTDCVPILSGSYNLITATAAREMELRRFLLASRRIPAL